MSIKKEEAKKNKNEASSKVKETKKSEQEASKTGVEAASEPNAEDVAKELESLKAANEKLTAENESLTASVSKEKDDYLRLMAEFENFRRRTAEEKLELVSSAASDTIKGLLPVLDDCEHAIKLLENSGDEAAKEGTNLIFTKLMQYLKKKGLERIEAKGQKFDTDFHEAVAQVPVQDESQKGLVYDVIETGYTFGGKILRYAKVVVAS